MKSPAECILTPLFPIPTRCPQTVLKPDKTLTPVGTDVISGFEELPYAQRDPASKSWEVFPETDVVPTRRFIKKPKPIKLDKIKGGRAYHPHCIALLRNHLEHRHKIPLSDFLSRLPTPIFRRRDFIRPPPTLDPAPPLAVPEAVRDRPTTYLHLQDLRYLVHYDKLEITSADLIAPGNLPHGLEEEEARLMLEPWEGGLDVAIRVDPQLWDEPMRSIEDPAKVWRTWAQGTYWFLANVAAPKVAAAPVPDHDVLWAVLRASPGVLDGVASFLELDDLRTLETLSRAHFHSARAPGGVWERRCVADGVAGVPLAAGSEAEVAAVREEVRRRTGGEANMKAAYYCWASKRKREVVGYVGWAVDLVAGRVAEVEAEVTEEGEEMPDSDGADSDAMSE
ncbi:hypothetical protein HDU96_004812 [Phlyctochytrium bullatum]|nr:hypothetical protein HDU96_004812 [Phlyctochytrium bullatum]